MKKIIGLLALVSSLSSIAAFAADENHIEVACRDARTELRDAGLVVHVKVDGKTGKKTAVVMRQSIMGPKLLATFPVTENNRGMERVFTGNGFKLSILLESLVPTENHPANVSFRVIVEGDIAQQIKGRLTCNILD